MRRTIATILVGSFLTTGQAAPVFTTGTGPVTMSGDFSGYINLGLQGVGRIPASKLDAFGDTFGSVSGLQISNWKLGANGYTGSFLVLPDRGYNSGAVYSDYRARVQQVDFSFSPYTGAGSLSSTQSQLTLNYMGGSLIREAGGTANTTGALPNSSAALQVGSITSGIVPTTAGGKIAFDAEGVALFKDGSGYITDEYGPNIYYVKDGQIGAAINPPASAMPRTAGGSLTFTISSNGTSAVDPTSGRRSNQGMEAVAITPDGKTLFTMLQSATMQDSVSGGQNRQFTRLYKYDVSQSRENPVLTAEYVVELPRFNDTKADQTGLVPNKVAAQSEMVALDGERLLLLARDGNGNGNSGVTAAVFKSVMLMDLSKGSPTNIASLDTTPNYSVISGTVSSPIVSGTTTLTDTTAKLNPAITPVSPVQFLNLIGQNDLSKFGLNTNDGSAANPRSSASLSEKWEGMALVSALDPAKPNDYFLFVGNDNDFLTSNLKMKSTTGAISTNAGPFGASVENDTMFLAYRLTLPAGGVDQSILTIGSSAASASMATYNVVDTGSGLSSGTSKYGISGSTLLVPGSLTVSRPLDVGLDGGGVNLLGHSVVLNGSVSGTGALTVFGTSTGARLLLGGNNSFEGGLEINGVRVEASQAENLGTGQVNLNAGAVLSLLQSGTFSQDAGLYVGGGTMEVAATNEVLWTGSIVGPGRLTKVGAGSLALSGASTFSGGLTVQEGVLALGASSLAQGETLTASPVGIGTLTVQGGASLAFKEQGIFLLNTIRLSPGINEAAPVLLDLGDNLVEFAGPVDATASLGVQGNPSSQLTLWGTTSLSGDVSVQGATVRLSEALAKAPETITLRSGGGLQSLGDVQIASTIVLLDTGRLDGGEGVLALSGDITGAGTLRIGGSSPFGTVRLEGLNTYTGGTFVEDTRVEIAVHGGEGPTGLGGVFGSGDVNLKNATLAFGTSSRISNTLKLQGEVTIDVAENIGELAGAITDDVSGPGSLYITGSPLGALTLSGTSNSYTGPTVVEGTTLRLLHNVETPGTITLRSSGGLQSLGNVQVSSAIVLEDEGRLDGGEGLLSITGDITGGGWLRISGSPYGTVRLEGLNSYTGGTFLEDTRVEVAVHGGEGLSGTEGVFGSGDVNIKSATLAFATSSRIHNPLSVHGELTIDVAEHTGELAGSITDDVSGPGSLYITGSPLGALLLSGSSNSYTGPTVVEGTTLRLLHNFETPSTITLRSSGGLQSLGNVQVSSSIVLEDEGRLDGGEGLLSLTGDITGAGRLRISGSPYGTVRLEGLNSYTGGTSLEDTRVEVAVHGGEGLTGTEGVFGSGEVSVKNATLAFATASQIQNTFRLQGELTIDVAENIGELSGSITDDVSGPGSLYITGSPLGALTLSGTSNSYTGPTVVEGTTLRLLHTPETPGTFTLRSGGGLQSLGNVQVSSMIILEDEGRLDGGEGVLSLAGDITGTGRLRIVGNPFGTVRLEGLNTYTGGTTVEGTRVEVAVHGADESGAGSTGSGAAFGSGGVNIKDATLAFATSTRIPNAFSVNGEFTIDVAENIGELSGPITDDVSGPGSLYITGSPLGALTLSGTSNSYTGPIVVEGTTLRFLHTPQTTGTTTLRSGGGLQSLGNVQISTSVVLEDEGRLDGGDGVLSLVGDITGSGRLRVVGNPFGTVRLEGLNTYTGGTAVEDTRVEVAVYGADESAAGPAGAGGAFGSGEVSFKNATLAFGTSSRISNALRVHGELAIDVAENTGELSGSISDDASGSGSLYVTGSPRGALMLSGTGSSYTGPTIVEGTTLRLFHNADTSVLGVGTHSSGGLHPIQLDGATLQIVPDYSPDAPISATPVTGRGVVFGARGATLDVSDSSVVWTGVISGGDRFASGSKLTVAGAVGSQVELAGPNTYVGGTDIQGGVLVKVSSDDNLGAAGTPVTLSNGGLFYGGSGAFNWSRPLTVLESGLIDVGSRTVTVTGTLSGGGILEVGRKAYEGSTFSSTTGVLVVGTSTAGFTGRTVVSGGSLLVSTSDALRKSTLETVANSGGVGFATPNVSLGGLAGDGPLHLSTAGTLSVGFDGRNTRYSGVLSGGSLTLAKVGSGNLSLGAVNTYAGPTNLQEGTLTLELGADLGPAPISLSSKVTLVINGAGRDLSTRFGSVAADSLVVFNGSDPNGLLKLPAGFAGTALSLGTGGIQVGTAAATSGSTVGKGVSISLTTLPSSSVVTLSGGSIDLSPGDGSQITVNGVKSLESRSSDDVVTVKEGSTVRLTAGLPSSAFKGTFQTDGQVIVSPTNSAEVVALPRLKGSGKLTLQGGSAVIVASPEFTGTTSISNGASAVLTGSLGIGSGAALELAAGSSLKVVPQSVTEQVTLPSLSGGGSVSLQAGKVLISGGNSAFSGSLTVAKGVDVTVRGDLPVGNINVVDPTLPLKAEVPLAGNVSIPGTVTGAGGLSLAGEGTFTLTGNAKIETAQLVVGGAASAADANTVLDVSSLPNGVLRLSERQSLGGGGRIRGSVATSGLLTPGNSPGTLTVEKNTLVDGSGNLDVRGSSAVILIEYGVKAGTSQVTADRVVVAGALTLGSQVKIVVSKFVDSGSWTSFVTPASLDLGVVFSAGSIVAPGTLDVSLDGNPLLSRVVVTPSATTLSFRIEKVPYATYVTAPGLQPLAQYLSAAGTGSPSTGLVRYLSVLDASVSQAELNALVASLQSPVYAEAQRLSLRRTAAVSETLQGRLVRGPKSSEDGWAAWSESYGWAFHRGATASAASWNGRNFGEVLGVQNTRAGLTFGLFGAAGTTNASFSAPGSSLSGESFHGGAFVHAESGNRFVDASILAGRAEQTAVRNVSFGTLSGQGRARFSTGEYAGHLRFGLQTSELAEGFTLKPSVAVLFNGYSQGGAAESGLDGVGVVTRKQSGAAWQTRLGFEAMKKARLGGNAFDLLASAYWVRDANRGARSVETRFNGSSVGGYSAEGSTLGANGLELGVGAGVNLTSRTSARLNGVWQVREGSSQPGVNLGVTVQF